MKIFIPLIITASLISLDCFSQNISDLQWLTGHWVAVKNKPGKLRTERWENAQNSRMLGFGTITQGSDTTFLEKMQIEN
ncbi:MAG: hypothetical protein EOO01_44430, partial [Chitinophagaceae bacterium]